MPILHYYRRLAGWERLVVCRLALLQLLAWVTLRLVKLDTAARFLGPVRICAMANSFPGGLAAAGFANRCHALSGAMRLLGLFRNGCLERSIALQYYLAGQGIATVIRVGVLPGTLPLHAHAWLEFEGLVLGGEDVTAFREIGGFAACFGEAA